MADIKTGIMRIATIIIAALLMCVAVTVQNGQAYATTSGGFTYTIKSGDCGYGAYITDCKDKNPVVPAMLAGKPVVSVVGEIKKKKITLIDVAACKKLIYLDCYKNNLIALDVSKK